MKSLLAPVALLVALYLAFLGYVLRSTPQLPERVATHFDLAGQANGWMSRAQHLTFMVLFGIGFPLVLVLSALVVRIVPDGLINLPRREYWLAPERREQTIAYLFRHMLWLACLSVVFAAGLQYALIEANRQAPPHLSSPMIWGLAGCFLVAVAAWAMTMVRHFYRGA